MLTNKQVKQMFRDEVLPEVIRQYGSNDKVAIRTAFNDWTDALHRSGKITQRQYETITYD